MKWEKSRVANVYATVSREGDYYRIMAHARTTKPIEWIYRLKLQGQGVIEEQDFSAVKTVLDKEMPKRTKRTEITYLESGEIKTTETVSVKKQPPTTTEMSFTPEGYVLDMFSAFLVARSLNWNMWLYQQRRWPTNATKSTKRENSWVCVTRWSLDGCYTARPLGYGLLHGAHVGSGQPDLGA